MQLKTGQIYIKEVSSDYVPSGTIQPENPLGIYTVALKPDWITDVNINPYVYYQKDDYPLGGYTSAEWALGFNGSNDQFSLMFRKNSDTYETFVTGKSLYNNAEIEIPPMWKTTGSSSRDVDIIFYDNFYQSGIFSTGEADLSYKIKGVKLDYEEANAMLSLEGRSDARAVNVYLNSDWTHGFIMYIGSGGEDYDFTNYSKTDEKGSDILQYSFNKSFLLSIEQAQEEGKVLYGSEFSLEEPKNLYFSAAKLGVPTGGFVTNLIPESLEVAPKNGSRSLTLASPTPTPTVTPSITISPTQTPTVTPTVTQTPSATTTPEATPTVTPTVTSTITPTPSVTASPGGMPKKIQFVPDLPPHCYSQYWINRKGTSQYEKVCGTPARHPLSKNEDYQGAYEYDEINSTFGTRVRGGVVITYPIKLFWNHTGGKFYITKWDGGGYAIYHRQSGPPGRTWKKNYPWVYWEATIPIIMADGLGGVGGYPYVEGLHVYTEARWQGRKKIKASSLYYKVEEFIVPEIEKEADAPAPKNPTIPKLGPQYKYMTETVTKTITDTAINLNVSISLNAALSGFNVSVDYKVVDSDSQETLTNGNQPLSISGTIPLSGLSGFKSIDIRGHYLNNWNAAFSSQLILELKDPSGNLIQTIYNNSPNEMPTLENQGGSNYGDLNYGVFNIVQESLYSQTMMSTDLGYNRLSIQMPKYWRIFRNPILRVRISAQNFDVETETLGSSWQNGSVLSWSVHQSEDSNKITFQEGTIDILAELDPLSGGGTFKTPYIRLPSGGTFSTITSLIQSDNGVESVYFINFTDDDDVPSGAFSKYSIMSWKHSKLQVKEYGQKYTSSDPSDLSPSFPYGSPEFEQKEKYSLTSASVGSSRENDRLINGSITGTYYKFKGTVQYRRGVYGAKCGDSNPAICKHLQNQNILAPLYQAYYQQASLLKKYKELYRKIHDGSHEMFDIFNNSSVMYDVLYNHEYYGAGYGAYSFGDSIWQYDSRYVPYTLFLILRESGAYGAHNSSYASGVNIANSVERDRLLSPTEDEGGSSAQSSTPPRNPWEFLDDEPIIFINENGNIIYRQPRYVELPILNLFVNPQTYISSGYDNSDGLGTYNLSTQIHSLNNFYRNVGSGWETDIDIIDEVEQELLNPIKILDGVTWKIIYTTTDKNSIFEFKDYTPSLMEGYSNDFISESETLEDWFISEINKEILPDGSSFYRGNPFVSTLGSMKSSTESSSWLIKDDIEWAKIFGNSVLKNKFEGINRMKLKMNNLPFEDLGLEVK